MYVLIIDFTGADLYYKGVPTMYMYTLPVLIFMCKKCLGTKI